MSTTPPNDLARKELRVLVVDDEKEMLDILATHLKSFGFRLVDQASDGEQALEKCKALTKFGARYDLIVSDWKMPKISGIDLLKKIRLHPVYKKSMLMLLTAVDDKEHIQTAIKSGADDYLLKPFSKDEFKRKIGALVLKLGTPAIFGLKFD